MADARNQFVLPEAAVQKGSPMEHLLEKLQAYKDAIDERNETINKHLAATLGELRSMADLVRDIKTMVDIDSSLERESQEITESHTVTTGVSASQVPTSVLERSHRFLSRSLEVCEDLRYTVALVEKNHVQFECVNGKNNAYHVFDRRLLRKYKLQKMKKLSLYPKSWTFKFKERKLMRVCNSVASILTLTSRAEIDENQRFESGRANHVWKPGRLMCVNAQLIWLERFNNVEGRIDAEVLTTGKTFSFSETYGIELNQNLLKMGLAWVMRSKWHVRMILEYMLFKYKEPHAIVLLSLQGLHQTDIEEILWLLVRDNDKENSSDCEIQAVFELLIMVKNFSLGVEFCMDNVVLIKNPVKITYSVWVQQYGKVDMRQHELSKLEHLRLDSRQSISRMLGEFVRHVVTVFSAVMMAGVKSHTKHKWRSKQLQTVSAEFERGSGTRKKSLEENSMHEKDHYHLKKLLAAVESFVPAVLEILDKSIAVEKCLKHISLKRSGIVVRMFLEHILDMEQNFTGELIRYQEWQATYKWSLSLQMLQAIMNCKDGGCVTYVILGVKGEPDFHIRLRLEMPLSLTKEHSFRWRHLIRSDLFPCNVLTIQVMVLRQWESVMMMLVSSAERLTLLGYTHMLVLEANGIEISVSCCYRSHSGLGFTSDVTAGPFMDECTGFVGCKHQVKKKKQNLEDGRGVSFLAFLKRKEARFDALKGAYVVIIKVELPANHLAPFLMYEMFHFPRPPELTLGELASWFWYLNGFSEKIRRKKATRNLSEVDEEFLINGSISADIGQRKIEALLVKLKRLMAQEYSYYQDVYGKSGSGTICIDYFIPLYATTLHRLFHSSICCL